MEQNIDLLDKLVTKQVGVGAENSNACDVYPRWGQDWMVHMQLKVFIKDLDQNGDEILKEIGVIVNQSSGSAPAYIEETVVGKVVEVYMRTTTDLLCIQRIFKISSSKLWKRRKKAYRKLWRFGISWGQEMF